MKLYKNGVCVYEYDDGLVETIAKYINENIEDCIEFLKPWDYIKNGMWGSGESISTLVDMCPGIMSATQDDYIIMVYTVPFFYPFDMQESNSAESVDVWLSVLQQIDFDAIWKIELDEQ